MTLDEKHSNAEFLIMAGSETVGEFTLLNIFQDPGLGSK